ncbi:TPA: recombinase family protein [Streptococcus suis]|nr:recombinase family protein [Streptococcus suis]HEL1797566.1 recombinase family protein [Streptococcus suis]
MTKIALYLRLSVDESDTDESNSIINQRYLLNHYLDQTIEFKNWARFEYVDDGFSGTSLKRPAFQRMMADVKAGTIRHIIVKDLSRFMRDYLELGNYLENIFPFLGVRFIALNDHYDSLVSEHNGLDIDVPFRNLLNDFYAKDVSEKVKSTMNSMKRSGKNMSWLPPFGYIKDPNDRFKIIIDEEVAPIVRRIFRLCIEGMGTQKIAMLLNSEQTITPAERKMQVSQARYTNSIIITAEQKRNVWTKSSVRQILKNEAYKGTYLFNTRMTVNGRQIKRPEPEWERIENNHESIVSTEVFFQAQQSLVSRICGSSSRSCVQPRDILLRGLVVCEHCGHRLLRFNNHNNYDYFYCRYCKSQGHRMKACRSDRIEKVIEEKLLTELPTSSPTISKSKLMREIERLKVGKMSYFQEYKEGLVTRETYMVKRQSLDDKIMNLDEQLREYDSKNTTIDKKLSKSIVETHVEKILVDCLGFFKVIYK